MDSGWVRVWLLGRIWMCVFIKGSDLKTSMTEPIYHDEATREGINALTLWGEWGLLRMWRGVRYA